MEPLEHKPPLLALIFFRWYCNENFCEEIEGDLTERFHFYLEKYGHKKAKWFFIKEVLLLFRPTIIGNIHQLINKNSTSMTTQNNKFISQKLKWSRIFSVLAILLGLVLLVYMITVESEPGGIPLLLIAIGTIWFFYNQYLIKKSLQ